jgi:hypothetical protein
LGFNDITETDPDVRLSRLAQHLNRHWDKFTHLSDDVNNIELADYDLIINTSTEHFASLAWWENIPPGTAVALQGNNMQHDDHVNITNTLSEFCSQFPVAQELYRGELDFRYPDWEFTRYMLIGVK